MPLETASYINSLVASNPASTDTVSQADDHIRLIKKVLKDTFPNINAPVTATPAALNSAVPTGFIGMWSGSAVTIPIGWGLCDGSAGRPDLRDRFIVGSGTTYAIGATGGASTVSLTSDNLPSHAHTFSGSGSSGSAGGHSHTFSGTTESAGSHAHNVTYRREPNNSDNPTYPIGGTDGSTASVTVATASAGDHTHTFSGTTASVAAHTHTVSVTGIVGSTGSNTAHENKPPYFALAFIIKL